MLKESSLAFTSWLFLRFLAIINLIAFISIWTQIDGLIGSEGILPAQDYFTLLQERLGPERYLLAPSLFWFNASDTALHFICGTGIFLSLLLIVNIAPVIILFLLWLFYLSLTVAGQDFLSFQWDILLLEINFVAIFIAPRRLFSKYGKFESPSFLGIWLLRFLLFKLMFLSGAVKLLSGDSTWRDLTALFYHYETQPLPTVIGWYVHQLPQFLQKASVVLMFAIELLVPFLIFTPRKLRIYGFFILTSFQIMIFVTGNYCFFNLLTIALCIMLLDDEMFRQLLKIKNHLK